MRNHQFNKKTVSILSAAIAASFATSASAWVNPLEHRYVSGTLDVCDYGSFYVGGVPKITNFAAGPVAGAPQQLTIGQMYVQFMVPKKRRTWPLIIMHGSGYTGACVESSADGREGWVPYAVRHNLAVFNVDQPGRARSGFDRSVIHEGASLIATNPAAAAAMIPSFGGAADENTWTNWYGHIIPDGTNIVTGTMIRHGDPGDPDPPEDFSNPSQAHGNYPPAFPIPPLPNSIDPSIAARIGAIGPAPNPANNLYLALEAYKWSVPNTESTLPGSICPACSPTTLSGQVTWGPRAMAELVERLGGAIISGHSQGGAPMFHTVRILKEHGHLDLVKGIILPESGGTSLTGAGLVASDFDTIPLLVVNGDYRALATRQANRAAVAEINASPTRKVSPAEVIDTENVGPQFNGHTHMNMLGTTNLLMFDLMLEWANRNISNPLGDTQCEAPTTENINAKLREAIDLLRQRAR